MRDNTVIVDRSQDPVALRFAPVFNVAVPFIDRHLDEGRSAKVAIRTDGEDVTYGVLAERVNRSGNALRDLGVGAGERLLMVVKDGPEVVSLFFGAVKSGIIPVPVNTLMRDRDYSYLIDDSDCAVLVYSPEFADAVESGLATATHRPRHVFRATGTGSFRDLASSDADDLVPIRTAPGDDCFWL